MLNPDETFAKAVRQTGAAISNLIGILNDWQARDTSCVRVRHESAFALKQARIALLDLWSTCVPAHIAQSLKKK